jgi:5-methylcytosine-specific restriction endonuclease McrA
MTFKCDRCGYEVGSRCLLKRHFERKLPCPPKVQDVPISTLQQQLDASDKIRAYRCKHCNKAFTESPNMYRHQKTCKQKPNNVADTQNASTQSIAVSTCTTGTLNNSIESIQSHSNKYNVIASKDDNIKEDNDATIQQTANVKNDIKRKKRKIRHATRIVCWNTYVGEDVAKTKCLCCKTNVITQLNFHCGHVTAEANGGTLNIDNLRPICAICNNSMGTQDMKDYAKNMFNIEINLGVDTLNISPTESKTNDALEFVQRLNSHIASFLSEICEKDSMDFFMLQNKIFALVTEQRFQRQ